MEFTKEIQQALASPFEDSQVGWKPQVTTKGKNKEPIMRGDTQVAGCTAHIDARAVMNRLDEVVGVGNWSDCYTVLPNGKNVECTLTVFGVSKSDVGEPNDGGFADMMKAAYSDALKRAAVKFGIGRYLYDMEMEWLPFDGYKVTGEPHQPKTGSKTPPARQNPAPTPRQQQSPAQMPPQNGGATQAEFEAMPDNIGGYRVNDDVLVKGKSDEKPGTVKGLDHEGGLIAVSVGDKVMWLKPDKLVKPPAEQPALIGVDSGAYSE